ncbi:hypothetical protein AUK14_01830 [Candidatus Berkelbacteria bacterium CG2_30_39_44]|nr:MAG: hypothetical protein AUK14_01830 [Candidatus Berkelbacteria bacterium CG2_30_39_44]
MFQNKKFNNLSTFEERLKYLEDNLAQVQASTKTFFKYFSPIHNELRASFKPYYFWHLVRYSSLVHWLILILTFIYLIALIVALTSTQYLL